MKMRQKLVESGAKIRQKLIESEDSLEAIMYFLPKTKDIVIWSISIK